MKTLQANNYEQMIKELDNLDESLISKVNKEISYANRKHYHVVTVRIIDRPGKVKNDTKVNVQMYHKPGFDKIVKNFKNTGSDYCFILHDPSQSEEEVEIFVPSHKLKQTEAQIRAKVQAEAEDEIKRRVAEEVQDYKDSANDEESENDLFALKDIRALNQEGLIDFAKEYEIETNGETKVRELKKIVIDWAKVENQKINE